jgi:cephalosporin-C deacetylase-like acetyl esterase
LKALEELLHDPRRADMVPDFIVRRVAQLAAQQREARKTVPALDRATARQDLAEALGLSRIPSSNSLTLVDRIVEHDHVIEKIVFEATPGLPVPGLLYLPNGPGPHPAVVHPPGHWMEDAKLASPIQQVNLRLVRNGIATLCYDTLGQGERRIGWHQHGQLAPLLVGFTSLGLMVRDSLRALDILEARDDVDGDRLGIVGASGGGFSSIFASVLDERITVAAISSIVNTHESQIRDAGFGTGWDSWVDLCNQVPGLCAIGSVGEILACVAPRSLLIAHAEDDPGFPLEGAREVAAEVRQLLDAEDATESFSYLEVPGGHGFKSPDMRSAVVGFLVAKLMKSRDVLEASAEPSFAPQWPVPHNQATATRRQSTSALASSGTCLAEPIDSNAPLVTLARERASQLRRRRRPLSTKSLNDMLGPFPDRTPLRARVANHLSLEASHAQRLTVQTEPGITIDALFLLPHNWTDALPPVFVMLDEGGKGQALMRAEVDYAREQGWAVLLPDLRGTGESAASEFEVASAAWMLDRDLLNQRTWDTLRLVDFLSERYSSGQQIDKGRILLWGAESFGLVALLAAALDERVAGAAVAGMETLEEALLPNVSLTPMLFHYNLLETVDLRDLQEFIRPRPALIGVAETESGAAMESLLAGCR